MTKREKKDLKRKLPKFRQEEGWQREIDDAKRAILGLKKSQSVDDANVANANVARLSRKVVSSMVAKKDLERELHIVNTDLEALNQIMASILDGAEQESVKLSSGVTIYLKRTVYPTIVDKSRFFAYLKRSLSKEELFGMLSVHPSTFKSFVTELLENGHDDPPGTKVFTKVSAGCLGIGKLIGGE